MRQQSAGASGPAAMILRCFLFSIALLLFICALSPSVLFRRAKAIPLSPSVPSATLGASAAATTTSGRVDVSPAPPNEAAAASLRRMPLRFETNDGQTDAS